MDNINLEKNLKNDIFSADTGVAVAALKIIKEKGNKLYLPMLFDLLVSSPEDEIGTEIKSILGSVKQRDAVPVFVEALKEEKYKPIRKTLLAACWQNGLDFKEHLPLFTKLVIEEDWETGFEAFTVIDNLKELPDLKIIEETESKIISSIDNVSDKKRYFLQEILYRVR
jgi:hypothetical protein